MDAELKQEARELAFLFCRDEEQFLSRFHARRFRYSAAEWDAILRLAQVYAGVMAGEVSRQAAREKQRQILCGFGKGGGKP